MGALNAELWFVLRLVIIAAFLTFFAGYAWGRRRGKKEGFVEGLRYAPLEMRRVTWERGHCVICGSGGLEPGEEKLT